MGDVTGIHVIVVDDDALMLRMLQPALLELRTSPPVTRVETALDPVSAMEAVRAAPPGDLVVLSDFNLKAPQNGIDVLKEVASARPAAVRILISGYAAEQIGDVTGGGLIHGFVEKPLRVRDLYAPLERLIARGLGRSVPS